MDTEDTNGTDEEPSEMAWLGSEVGFVLDEIDHLEEAGPEGDSVEAIIDSIVTALREWTGFARRGEYREPEDVRTAADILAVAACTTLDRLPRKQGKLQIPIIAAIQHLQDFRDAIATCVATPERYRNVA